MGDADLRPVRWTPCHFEFAPLTKPLKPREAELPLGEQHPPDTWARESGAGSGDLQRPSSVLESDLSVLRLVRGCLQFQRYQPTIDSQVIHRKSQMSQHLLFFFCNPFFIYPANDDLLHMVPPPSNSRA